MTKLVISVALKYCCELLSKEWKNDIVPAHKLNHLSVERPLVD